MLYIYYGCIEFTNYHLHTNYNSSVLVPGCIS